MSRLRCLTGHRWLFLGHTEPPAQSSFVPCHFRCERCGKRRVDEIHQDKLERVHGYEWWFWRPLDSNQGQGVGNG